MSYSVVIRNTSYHNGEYDGGKTLAEARKEARWFAAQSELSNATIAIYKPTPDGERIKFVESIREYDWRNGHSDNISDNPISTGGKVAIGAGIIGILAALFWPKSAAAAVTSTPNPTTPDPNTPPAPDSPPFTPPVATPDPPADDTSKFPAPPGGGIGGMAVVWSKSGKSGTWSQKTVPLDISVLVDPATSMPRLDLKALFATLTMYVPDPTSMTPPKYQIVRLYYYNPLEPTAERWVFLRSFQNYGAGRLVIPPPVATPKDTAILPPGLYDGVRVAVIWQWEKTATDEGWSRKNIVPIPATVTDAIIAAHQFLDAVAKVAPPFVVVDLYQFSQTQGWAYWTHVKNF